ncbi:hypothetical protein AKUH1B104J_04830 [Apilactobacillus kunkeei]|nr:hypothetical protein AKUH1B104J_04830 [Apilactobacillus kunkeei]
MNSKIAAIIISICEFFLVALYTATGTIYTLRFAILFKLFSISF